jgi:hypothetical protein
MRPKLLGHHHLHELLVVDLAITIDIGLTDHLIDLLVGELLTQVGHDVTQLGGGDETISIAIEDLGERIYLDYRIWIAFDEEVFVAA